MFLIIVGYLLVNLLLVNWFMLTTSIPSQLRSGAGGEATQAGTNCAGRSGSVVVRVTRPWFGGGGRMTIGDVENGS